MKGILFKPDMIQAIVEGKKTQTRRVIKPQPSCKCEVPDWHGQVIDWIGYKHEGKTAYFCYKCGSGLRHIDEFSAHGIKPRYQPGEVVYIKEAWQLVEMRKGHYATALYAGGICLNHDWNDWIEQEWPKADWAKKRTPLFMPAWAARYHIKIISVDAQRVQEITEEDAKAEGASCHWEKGCKDWEIVTKRIKVQDWAAAIGSTYRLGFEILWDSINPKYPWESNPFVWKYRFELCSK